jgi:hypothetical protein
LKTLIFTKKRVLITVKAYPNPSYSYGETVCCAGIDLETSRWIRLYPISYRDLDSNKKFRKYSVIEIECAKAREDVRPESYRVREDSIRILSYLGTSAKDWEQRKAIVFSMPSLTLCELKKAEADSGTSLGLIKPSQIKFIIGKRPMSDTEKRASAYAQLGFFKKAKNSIEEIPYIFYYRFKCESDSACSGHELSINDWEINQAFRDWRNKYNPEGLLLKKIEERWSALANVEKNNVNFYVGNLHAHPKTFIILGTFSPKK